MLNQKEVRQQEVIAKVCRAISSGSDFWARNHHGATTGSENRFIHARLRSSRSAEGRVYIIVLDGSPMPSPSSTRFLS